MIGLIMLDAVGLEIGFAIFAIAWPGISTISFTGNAAIAPTREDWRRYEP